MSEPIGDNELSRANFDDILIDTTNSLQTYKALFIASSSANSMPELIRDWAVDNNYKKEDLYDHPFLIRLFARSVRVIKYANNFLNSDTDDYNAEDRLDLPFHKDLIKIAARIETDWKLKDDIDWRNKIKDEIDQRISEYSKAKNS